MEETREKRPAEEEVERDNKRSRPGESELMEETREKRPAEEEVERDNKRSRPGESELMEETREKRPAEEEVERDNKRSRPGEPEANGSTDERRDISMKVDGLDGEGIEEKLHIASLEADADEDFGGEEVGDLEFRVNQTGEYLGPELVAKARSEEVKFMAKIGLYHHGVSRDDREAADQHPICGCEQRVNGVAGCP